MMMSQKMTQRRACRSAAPSRSALGVKAVASVPKTNSSPATTKMMSPEVAKDMYYDMRLGRDFEDMCAQMYYRGKMFGFVHLYCGQEAVSTGVIRAMEARDYVCSTYRDHVHALSKGVAAREIMAELFGKKTGCCREGIPIGLGAAFQSKYKQDVLGEADGKGMAVTASFFGDGTCNVGQFYECLNMATLYKLPHIFVVENNLWAIGMSHQRATAHTSGDEEPFIYKKSNLWAIGMAHERATAQTAGDEEPFIYKKGPAFGMPGILVDGMDVTKVREVADEAIARARRGDGPTLIEASTYRFRGHSLADPDELRSKEEKANSPQKRDPIPMFKKYILDNKLATEADLKALDDQKREPIPMFKKCILENKLATEADLKAKRDPIPMFKKYILDNKLATEADLKALDDKVTAIVEDSVEFADESPRPEKGQLLENVFPDPRGFGIGPDGEYRYMAPGFSSGTAAVS
eukprot:gene31178-6322_t